MTMPATPAMLRAIFDRTQKQTEAGVWMSTSTGYLSIGDGGTGNGGWIQSEGTMPAVFGALHRTWQTDRGGVRMSTLGWPRRQR
jgi:hypothetical protein